MGKSVSNILLFGALFALYSCNEKKDEESPKIVYTACSVEDQLKNKCTRFMDRKIYLSYSTGIIADKNNEFQKLAVKEALQEIADTSNLGPDYFSFQEVDPTFIEPTIEIAYGTEFRSFIQILPDSEFNVLANNFGFIPDQNAITVINGANKRQFYIVFRASCFNPNQISCTNDSGAVMGNQGIKALVARQLGLLTGMSLNCVSMDRTMCGDFPRNGQWSTIERSFWTGSFNNALETISNNPKFYEEFFLE